MAAPVEDYTVEAAEDLEEFEMEEVAESQKMLKPAHRGRSFRKGDGPGFEVEAGGGGGGGGDGGDDEEGDGGLVSFGLDDLEDAGEGEGFGAVKPWMGAIVEPSAGSVEDPTKPDDKLDLTWVFGYRSPGVRNNVHAIKTGEIAYAAGSVVVIASADGSKQRHLEGHVDDVISIAVSNDGTLVAAGGLGSKPEILIWDALSGALKQKIKGFHRRSVLALSFSPDGSHIVSIGADGDHSMSVNKVATGKQVASTAVSSGRILQVGWNPHSKSTIVTAGVKHMNFWTLDPAGKLSSTKALFGAAGRPTTTSITFTHRHVWSGTATGDVMVWTPSGSRFKRIKTFAKVHKGAVYSLASTDVGCAFVESTDAQVVSGGAEGNVAVYKISNGSLLKKLAISERATFRGEPAGIIALTFVQVGEGRVGVAAGTRRAQVLMVDTDLETRKVITQGHYSGEVWGLAVHPAANLAVSVGDDNSIRMWDLITMECIADRPIATATAKPRGVEGGASTMGAYAAGSAGRAAAWSPDARHIAIGLNNGSLLVINAEDFKNVAIRKDRKEWIETISYSPCGTWLAVGSHDNFIDIYKVDEGYKPIAVCRGHSSFITAVDWSISSPGCLKSTCGAYELLFWDAPRGEQLPSGASELRDAEWASWTTSLGWPVQGIYQPGTKGSDINTVCVSNDKQLIAVGDDFSCVNLFRYPASSKKAQCRIYPGHSSHVTAVQFTTDDSMLLSLGGGDGCLFVWRRDGPGGEARTAPVATGGSVRPTARPAPPPPAPAVDINDGNWIPAYDASTGRTYVYHKVTRAVMWADVTPPPPPPPAM